MFILLLLFIYYYWQMVPLIMIFFFVFVDFYLIKLWIHIKFHNEIAQQCCLVK